MIVYLVLENIRSVENVGAIFRTADAAGVSKIFLVGITPAPIDRFGRWRKDLAKSALGAEKHIPWETIAQEKYQELLVFLSTEEFEIVALEQSVGSVDYKKYQPKKKLALIVGNEREGISGETLTGVDVILEIPMRGKKESLNVSVATGIALFRLLNL